MPRRKNKHPNSFAGRGMKPRGNAEEAKVESAQTENVVSTDQVQPEGTNEAGETALQGEQTPPSQEAETVQLLENPPEVPKAAFELAESLRKSAEAVSGASPDVANVKPTRGCNCALKGDPWKAPEQHAASCPESPEGRERERQAKLEPAAVIQAMDEDEHERHERAKKPDPAHDPLKPTDAQLNAPRRIQFIPTDTGQRENGDFGVVITIPESYVTSVKDFAEADGNKTPEQWCSEFFVMHLEAYCTPNRGR